MVDQKNADGGEAASDNGSPRVVQSSQWTGSDGDRAEDNPEIADEPASVGSGSGAGNRYIFPKLNTPEWISALAAVGATIAAIAGILIAVLTYIDLHKQLGVMQAQLDEMKAGSQDTQHLVSATWGLVGTGNAQARAMDKLQQAGQSQADAMDKLRKAGEAQADAMNKLRIAGETQAIAAERLADAGRSQAEATRNLAENSARQLGAIQASADAAKVQADAVQKQATATIAASQATDRLATAGQSQASAVLQSLDVAKAANDIANRASQSADRPWISITLPVDTNGPTAGQDYKVEVGISDVGRGPAINATSAIDMHIIGFNDTFNGFVDKCVGSCQTFMVFPTPNAFGGSSMALHPKLDAAIVTADEVKRIADRKDAVLLRVRVDYRDSSGNDHTTSRCDYFVPKLGFSPCSAGNVAN